MLDVVVNLMQKKITWHAFELHKYHSVPTNKTKLSKKKAQKGISLLIMLLLVMVSPTIVLSSDKIVGLANAQSANQTSSGSFPPPPGGGGGPGGPGFGPPQFSAESIGTVATNQTCSVTPSIVEEEEEDEEVATTPQATEGPYFVDEMLNRSDISLDPSDGSVQGGMPMTVVFRVYDVNEGTCIPIEGALVDIWQANATGVYSDVEQAGTAGTKFLRGYQITDENGTVQFTSVYPGWYQGRAVHTHFKIRMFEGSEKTLEFTSQLFFNDTVTDEVFSQPPYSDRGTQDVRNNQDGIFNGPSTDGLVQSNTGEHLMFNLTKQDQGYLGTFNVGLKLNQTGQ